MRSCKSCGESKPVSEYHRRLNGLARFCKPCAIKARVEHDKKHPEAARKRYTNWLSRPGNKEKAKGYYRKYYAKNKEKYTRNTLNRLARLKGAAGKHSLEEIRQLKERQKNKCAVCRVDVSRAFHVDHVVPLVSGGSNDIHNIQILCPSCNTSKGAKDPVAFMQSRGLLL